MTYRFATHHNLSTLALAQGFTLWHYRGNIATLGAELEQPVTLAQVTGPSFFHPVKDMLAEGDMIGVSASDGGALLYVGRVDPIVTVVPFGFGFGPVAMDQV